MKILTIGGATTDIFITCKHAERLSLDLYDEQLSFLLLEEGHKIELDTLAFHTGGGATNSAVSFKKLGFEVAICCKVGNDQPGLFIKQRLASSGIDTSHIISSSDFKTGHSFIIPCKGGDRTVMVYRGASTHLIHQELPTDLYKEYNNVYITSLSGHASHLLVPIVQAAKAYDALVCTNPGTSQLAIGAHSIYEALPYIDIFILNSSEACTFMLSMAQRDVDVHQKVLNTQLSYLKKNHTKTHTTKYEPELMKSPISYHTICFDIRLFFNEVLSRGPKIVVVTNGAEGVYVATKDEIIFHPSLPEHIESTLGAGDAFGSCFVAKYIEGASIKEAMLNGILQASSVISHLGAKEGLLTNDELARKYHDAPKDLFQTFPWDT